MIRKAASLLLLSIALLAPTVATTASTAAASTAGSTAAQARQTIKLTIDSITPEVPREPTTEIKLSGKLRNTSGAALTNLRIHVRPSAQRFTDRAAMEAYATEQVPAPGIASRISSLQIPLLEANGEFAWTLTVTPVQIGLTSFGVYPLTIEVVDGAFLPVVAERTFLAYAPKGVPIPKNRLAVALPMIDQPHRSADSTFTDDNLRTSIIGSGRLADLLRIAKDAPKTTTWFVDPALLEDVQAMAKPYEVKKGDDEQPRPADASATQWLESVRTALAPLPVVATPYADPDIAALAHQGLDGLAHRAIDTGAQEAGTRIKPGVSTATNWPIGGMLDADALDLLSVRKVGTVLLNADNVPPQPPVLFTPDATATLNSVNGPVTALVADPGLSRTLETVAADPSSSVLNRQRFIAETAMIAGEVGPTAPRSLVMAPPRRWNPNPEHVSALLDTAQSLPWLTSVPLSALKPGKASVPRPGLVYSEANRKVELGRKYLDSVKKAVAKVELAKEITTVKTPSGFERSVLRLTSAAWRGHFPAASAESKRLADRVDDRLGEISITGATPNRPRTLAGSDGVVPISVKNNLKQDVTVEIVVTSNNRDLLQIGDYGSKPLLIGSKQNGTVQVPMKATTGGGDAMVTVQLKTAEGLNYGAPVKLTIRTTGYTGIALVIVGGALSVMLAAVVMRILRRRSPRRSARASATRESERV